MKLLPWCLGLLTVSVLGADEKIDVQSLKEELRDLRQRTEQLEKKIQALENSPQSTATNIPAIAVAPATSHPASSVPFIDVQPSGGSEAAKWTPASPIQTGSRQNYISISFDVLGAAGSSTATNITALEPGGHDPSQRGFTLQNAELTLEGKIDPWLRGQANAVLLLDSQNDTEVELEEAWLETMSLPANLQLRAGQILTDFGRINPTHPHTWDFVDAPLVNARFFGPDGLRNPGARLSWLAPTPFYSELFLSVQDSEGETAWSFRDDHAGDLFFGRPAEPRHVRASGDLLITPRYAMSFDLSDSQTVLGGVSAAFGPNSSGGNTDTQVYGADLFYKWKSPSQHGGFPFVKWQTEAMLRRFDAGAFGGDAALAIPALPGETVEDYGMYSQVSYGFRKGWVAALRGDYVAPVERTRYEALLGPDLDRASRWRLSPNLTWYPSEFSKVRLQYNFDHRNLIGDDHSIWMQFEFLLGAHAAHKF